MRHRVIDHPLVAQKVTALRDASTTSPAFRTLTDELVTMLAYEATRSLQVVPVEVTTPLTTTTGVALAGPPPLVVPVLRAGLGMLPGLSRVLPGAEVGFAGLARNEETLEPIWYADRLPRTLADRHVFVLDPMLATGGTLRAVIAVLAERGAAHITALCLLAAPEGIAALEAAFPGDSPPLDLVVAACDSHLDPRGYIWPGLGDAGDRLFGPA